MDKNSVIGLFLIGVVIVLFSIYNSPSKEEMERSKKMHDSLEALKTLRPDSIKNPSANTAINENINADTLKSEKSISQNDSLTSLNLYNQFGLFSKSGEGTEEFYSVENEVMKVTFSNKGGRIYKVELKKYKTYDSLPLVLLDGPGNQFNFQFFTNNINISTQDLFFEKTSEAFLIKGDEHNSISFRVYTNENKAKYIEQKYTFKGDSYLIDYDFNLIGFDDILKKDNDIGLNWETKIRRQEKNYEYEQHASTAYYKYSNEKPDYLSETKDLEEKLSTSVEWVSFKQQFFNQSLIAKNKFGYGKLKTKMRTDSGFIKTISANLFIAFNQQKDFSFPMQFYFGPNHYQTLNALGNDLEKIIPLGWVLFRWINKYAIIPTFNFLNQFISNYGIIILLLTILLKLVLFLPTYKSFYSMAKMNVLKPEIEEIKQKFGDDQTKMSSETMKLYQKAGVNPMGGCLPTLLTMPILIAMYIFFPSSIELRQQSFLWANDLSTYDSILNLSFTIPFYGNHVSLFTLLMTISSLVYAHYNMQMSAQMNPQMKWMQYIFPIMLLGVFNQLSAALTYYYFLTNVFSFAQQFIMKKYFIDEPAIRRQIEEHKKKAPKKSGWQQRLEEMTKAQQQKRKK